MLSPEQIAKIRSDVGATPLSASGAPSVSLADKLKPQPTETQESVKPSMGMKAVNTAADIVGGRQVAEGLGKSLASGVVSDLSKVESTGSDLQLSILKRINEKKALGEDTSRLESALGMVESDINIAKEARQGYVSDLPTNKQVIGSAARLATTLAGGSLAKGATSLTGAKNATGVISGIVRGTGAGAITGATEGALQGAGLAMEENKSTEDILKSGAFGGVLGGVTGGVLGGVTGGITGAINKSKQAAETFSTKLASVPLTNKEKVNAIYQGRISDPKLLSQAEVQFSKRDEQLGQAIKDIVKPKDTLSGNINSIKTKVSEINNGVKEYVASNKVPFNTNQLSTQLNKGKEDLSLVFASDDAAEKTYNAVTKAFMNTIKNKDTAGLMEARQNFDKLPAIKKLLESDKLGENARKEIVLAVRKSANDYIASLLPDGNVYKNALKQETLMLEALGNIADKSTGIIGKNKLQLLTAEYPLLKWIIGGTATGLVGGAGVGVGSAIIGSTN